MEPAAAGASHYLSMVARPVKGVLRVDGARRSKRDRAAAEPACPWRRTVTNDTAPTTAEVGAVLHRQAPPSRPSRRSNDAPGFRALCLAGCLGLRVYAAQLPSRPLSGGLWHAHEMQWA